MLSCKQFRSFLAEVIAMHCVAAALGDAYQYRATAEPGAARLDPVAAPLVAATASKSFCRSEGIDVAGSS
jgi:hypothetical protein